MRPASLVTAGVLGALALSPLGPQTTAVPAQDGCRIDVGKVAAPSNVILGQEAAISLTVQARCSRLQVPLHVALVFDNSTEMGGERMNDMRSAVAAFVDELDFSVSRVGLAAYWSSVEVLSELTDNRDAVVLAGARFFPRQGSDLTKAVRAGRLMLQRGRSAAARSDYLEVMVVLSGSPNDGAAEDLLAEAQLARDEGMVLVTIAGRGTADLDTLEAIATSSSTFYVEGTGQRYPALFRQIVGDLAQVEVVGAEVVDTLPQDMTYVWGSGIPAPRTQGGDLVWRYDRWPSEGIDISYAVEPTASGCRPTNVRAWVELRFDRGEPQRYSFPVPTVCVLEPSTATPSPSATATATATESETVTPIPTSPPSSTAPPEPYPLLVPFCTRG